MNGRQQEPRDTQEYAKNEDEVRPLTDTEAKKPTKGASDRESPVQKPPGAPS